MTIFVMVYRVSFILRTSHIKTSALSPLYADSTNRPALVDYTELKQNQRFELGGNFSKYSS